MPPWLLGRLSWDALPFYSAIAAGGAGAVVLGGIGAIAVITWLGVWRYLWSEWLTSVDHKRIGVMYVVLALVMLVRGFIDAIMMRSQQAIALDSGGYLAADHYNQIFSSHGTIMIFFMATPFLTGLYNFVVPLQIGARDMAFPRMNAISLWLTAAGAGLVMVSLVIGRFSTGGWTGYPPYTGLGYSPGVGTDYWIWALTLAGVGTTLTGINFIVTIYKRRAPGMRLMSMPLFCWTALCVNLLIVFAFPALTVATSLLALDRYLGMHFFTNDLGGNMMNYANLFWLFGHPEVYILVLPAFGVYSEVISTFSGKRLFGYTSLVYATMAIAVLSFTVWLHHFFTMGASPDINAAFGVATMVIAIPTGVKIYDWLFTMFRGRIRFTVPMLYSLAFIFTFVIGGMTGILLAIPPVDMLVHNSTFLVAHFHNMIIPGSLFGFLAGYTYWFPKATGFRLDESWGRRAFWCWVTGFYLAFMPLYALGLMGMPRRMQQYDEAAWQPWLLVAEFGAVLILGALVCLGVQLAVSIRDRARLADATGDPWNGRSLEWATPSPPPAWNFAVAPAVEGRDAFVRLKRQRAAYREPEKYQDVHLPAPTIAGPLTGTSCFLLGFGLVWHIWWLAIMGLLAAWATLIVFSFRPDRRVTFRAEAIAAAVRRWHEDVRRADPRAYHEPPHPAPYAQPAE